jgi:hypothetical protein
MKPSKRKKKILSKFLLVKKLSTTIQAAVAPKDPATSSKSIQSNNKEPNDDVSNCS